jgi:hypothetical protein
MALTSNTRIVRTAILFERAHERNRFVLVAKAYCTPIGKGNVITFASWNRVLTMETLSLKEADQSVCAFRVTATVTFATLTWVAWTAISAKWPHQGDDVVNKSRWKCR